MSKRTSIVGIGLLLVLAAPARAQTVGKLSNAPIDLQVFRPAVDSKGFITLNASQILSPRDFSFGLVSTGPASRSLLGDRRGAAVLVGGGQPHHLLVPGSRRRLLDAPVRARAGARAAREHHVGSRQSHRPRGSGQRERRSRLPVRWPGARRPRRPPEAPHLERQPEQGGPVGDPEPRCCRLAARTTSSARARSSSSQLVPWSTPSSGSRVGSGRRSTLALGCARQTRPSSRTRPRSTGRPRRTA